MARPTPEALAVTRSPPAALPTLLAACRADPWEPLRWLAVADALEAAGDARRPARVRWWFGTAAPAVEVACVGGPFAPPERWQALMGRDRLSRLAASWHGLQNLWTACWWRSARFDGPGPLPLPAPGSAEARARPAADWYADLLAAAAYAALAAGFGVPYSELPGDVWRRYESLAQWDELTTRGTPTYRAGAWLNALCDAGVAGRPGAGDRPFEPQLLSPVSVAAARVAVTADVAAELDLRGILARSLGRCAFAALTAPGCPE